jgi:hypothetical protein
MDLVFAVLNVIPQSLDHWCIHSRSSLRYSTADVWSSTTQYRDVSLANIFILFKKTQNPINLLVSLLTQMVNGIIILMKYILKLVEELNRIIILMKYSVDVNISYY